MAQEEVDRIWKELHFMEQKIQAKEQELREVTMAKQLPELIPLIQEERERLVEEKKVLLSTLQARLASPSGASSLDAVVSGILEVKNLGEELKAGQQMLQAVVAERFSQTRQASKIKDAELEQVTISLKCRLIWAEDDPTLEALLGPEPEEDSALWWDEDNTEPAQRESYAIKLREHIPSRRGPGAFDLHDAKSKTVKTTFEGVPYPVAGRNDELISLRRHYNNPLYGAIMGVELKKKLTWASVRQAKTEFVLFATSSWYPYCQVATDLQSGGIAYYMSGHAGDERIITGRVFKGMASFWEFFSSYLNSVPEDLASDKRLFEDELSNPKRFRFHLEAPTQSGDSNAASRVHAALRTIANMYNNWGDVANVADLQGFHELDTHVDLPFSVS